jgi:membrane protein insertase Oxa1/YidC/SpoIIIJ
MAAKPDLVMPIAVGLAELINARLSTPSLEELRAHLRDAYMAAMSMTAMPAVAASRTRLAESMAAPRAEGCLR